MDGLAYLVDTYNKFFSGPSNIWVVGQSTTATTLSGAVSAGANVLPVADATGLSTGVVLVTDWGTASQTIYRVASVAANNVTIVGTVAFALASGAPVAPLWNNSGHMTEPAGWTALWYWVLKQLRPDGTLILQDPGATRPVVLLGNSWCVPALPDFAAQVHALYPSAVVTMAGVSGNHSDELIARFATDVPTNASYVFFNEPGVNDAERLDSRESMQADLQTLVAKIRAIGAIPVFIGPVPLQDQPNRTAIQDVLARASFGNSALYPGTDLASIRNALSPTSPSGSTCQGVNAGKVDTSGSLTAFGQSAATLNGAGSANAAFGQFALSSNVAGGGCAAFGQGALSASTGSSNTGLGASAGTLATSAINLTAVGNGAAAALLTANDMTAVGFSALHAATGSGQTAVGSQAAKLVTTGTFGVYVGSQAGTSPNFVGANASTTANSQTFVGSYSGQGSATQRDNVTAVGSSALVDGAGATALGSGASAGAAGAVAIGRDNAGTGASTTTANVVALGTALHQVQLKNNTTGAGSAALGANCPATTATAPFTWFKMMSSDGSTVYVPAWK